MLFKARLGENTGITQTTDKIFLNDAAEKIIPDGWKLENFIDNSGIEHVRVYKEVCDSAESDEIWEIYSYYDEAMPLELFSIQEDLNN